MNMLTSQELTNLLRERGYKVTPQRLAVYEALADETWHPNAEMLFNKLQPKFPAMSFATVYKTVEILHDINVIQILNTGEDSFRYDADVSEHYHLRCLKCGAVDDALMDDGVKLQLTQDVEKQSGCTISRRQFYFFGLCPKCSTMH